jgi:SOS response regulatory protein OraA/RecX
MQACLTESRPTREGWSGSQIAITIILILALIPVSIVSVVQWRIVRENETEAELKRDMLERGMSAAEIEHVLQAGQPRWNEWEKSMWTVEHAKIENNLKRDLAQMGLAADEIERIVKSSPDETQGKSSWQSVERARRDATAKKSAGQQVQAARQADHEAAVRELIRCGYSNDEISQLFKKTSKIEAGGNRNAPSGATQ